MDDEEGTKNSESPSDRTKEEYEILVLPISEKDKITKKSINTQKVTTTSNLISQTETSALTEKLLELKIPTNVSLLSVTGASVTSEKRIPRNKVI